MPRVYTRSLFKPDDRIEDIRKAAFYPPEILSLSGFADKYRYLPSESSPEPGKWNTARTPYMRQIMDDVTDPAVEQVILMSAAQVGKSEVILNALAYYIKQEPCPIMVVQPTGTMAQAFSKERVQPMINTTPAISDLVMEAKSRDSGNTILQKQFPGGFVALCPANPRALSSKPIRLLCFDEVDKYEDTHEGDPIGLGIKRTQNFFNRKIIMTSTPTNKNASIIEYHHNKGTQFEYYIQCQNCDEYFLPTWGIHVHWNKDINGNHLTETATLNCPACQYPHDDKQRLLACQKGEWKAKHPDRDIRSYHLSALLSPWIKLKDLAAKFVEAKQKPSLLRTFINTDLGEVWDDDAETDIQQIDFLLRSEEYTLDSIPNEILYLTCAVDVQRDRLECELLGWGLNDETWSLDYNVITGSPGTVQTWVLLHDYLIKEYTREDGVKLRILTACIDSGGEHTQMVYNFTHKHYSKRWYAVKGHSDFNAPAWPKYRTKTVLGKVYMVGSSAIKEMFYENLKNDTPGTYGYCHFPRSYDTDYYSQLTAERLKVTQYYGGGGVPKRMWVLRTGVKRNEALDLRVYNIAAKYSLGKMNLEKLSERLAKQKDAKPPVENAADVNISINTNAAPIEPPKKANKYDRIMRRQNRQTSWMQAIR